jgi:hypothetical protein
VNIAGHLPENRRTPLAGVFSVLLRSNGINDPAYEKDPCMGVLTGKYDSLFSRIGPVGK